MSEDDSDKQHEASQKKLADMRKEGQIARSQDLLAAAAYGGLLLAMAWPGGWALAQAGAILTGILAQADSLSATLSHTGRPQLPLIILPTLAAIAPFFAIPALAVLAMVTVQRAWLFTPKNLMPKLSRISPVSNAANKFGPNGLFEFGKSFVKLGLVSLVLGIFLLRHLDQVIGTLALNPTGSMHVLFDLLRDFVAVVLVIAAVLGGLDYLWQMLRHHHNARMSRQEVQDEHKESEGDPHVKSQRRQRGQDYAMNRMLQDVPKADVVIVNPTHYAVALKWDRKSGRAPVCVAKGVDEIAARIRERAHLAGVPLHSDPPTARALHAALKIGDEVDRSHYKAVAAAIRFAEAMRRKARERRG